MSFRQEGGMRAWIAAVLDTAGATDPAQRRTAAALDCPAIDAKSVDPRLDGYLDKVRRHAFTIEDADVAALRAAGFSEEALYELTISAACGQGMRRYDLGLAALRAAKGGGK